MIEEKYVYVIHYFTMRLDTGEIKDKIWLEGNSYYAKQFFKIRKDMIDRAVGKKPRIVEFERRNYYNVEVEVLKRHNYHLHVLTNQKYNLFLKNIQGLANINKTMTTHLARKTFCCLLLNRGVSINTVAKCAGHKDIKITRSYYATLQESTVIKEVKQALQI